MTTYVGARDAIVAEINNRLTADYPGLTVLYENTVEIDLATAPDLFLRVAIDFLATRQASIELKPATRSLGEILFAVQTKEGRGTREVLSIFDYLVAQFASKTVGGVTLKTPTPKQKPTKDGWATFEIAVPFLFDSTY